MHNLTINLLEGRRYSQPVKDQQLRHNKKEEVYWVDPRSHQLTVIQGQEDQVTAPRQYRESLEGSWTTHNHPNNSPPSIQDFLCSANRKEAGFRVITPDATYIVKPTNDKWDLRLQLAHTPTIKEWVDNFKFHLTAGKYGKAYEADIDRHSFTVDVEKRETELRQQKSYNGVWEATEEAFADLGKKYNYKFTRIENPSNLLVKRAMELSKQAKYKQADEVFQKAEKGDPHNYYVSLMKAIDYKFRAGIAHIDDKKVEARKYLK